MSDFSGHSGAVVQAGLIQGDVNLRTVTDVPLPSPRQLPPATKGFVDRHRGQVRPLLPASPGCMVIITSRSRLSGLAVREGAIRAVLDVLSSHADLARVFRLIGIHPGADIALDAAASLTGLAPPSARRHLESLVGLHLLARSGPNRYRLHDLLKLYAVGRVDPSLLTEARWSGGGWACLGVELIRAIRELLLGTDPPVMLTRRAVERLARERAEKLHLVHPGGTLVVRENKGDLR